MRGNGNKPIDAIASAAQTLAMQNARATRRWRGVGGANAIDERAPLSELGIATSA